MAEQWQVKQSGGAQRTVFAGTEDDARTFIVNNYPRVHAEAGNNENNELTPDVVLVSPDGVETSYNGVSWSDDEEASSTVDRPADDAPKSDWVTYALSVEQDESARAWIRKRDTTRDDLISEYGQE